jgi:acetylornithine/LysW-gamma-L-lysine aminotransferase
MQRGLLMLYSGKNIIRLLPPLVMDAQTVSHAIHIIDLVLSEEEKRRHVV